MDVNAYLKRIKYTGNLNPVRDVLFQLQKAHLFSVPFENLDIHNGREIRIDTKRIFNKIVNENRGGFCYELNGIFHFLLKNLGFEVKRISSRVYSDEKGFGPEYDHLTNLVTVDNVEYLVDVGFGDFSIFPLEFVLGKEQKDPAGIFIFEKYDEDYFIVRKKEEDKFKPVYIFSTTERDYTEYEPMCHFMQTSPDSHFVKKRLCTMPNEKGRKTITGDILKIKENGEITEETIKGDDHFRQILTNHFNIILE